MSDLDAALTRISELEDQCIALGDKVLHMLPVIDAARETRDGIKTGEMVDLSPIWDAIDSLDALPAAPQPRQPASMESDAVPDAQRAEPA